MLICILHIQVTSSTDKIISSSTSQSYDRNYVSDKLFNSTHLKCKS